MEKTLLELLYRGMRWKHGMSLKLPPSGNQRAGVWASFNDLIHLEEIKTGLRRIPFNVGKNYI